VPFRGPGEAPAVGRAAEVHVPHTAHGEQGIETFTELLEGGLVMDVRHQRVPRRRRAVGVDVDEDVRVHVLDHGPVLDGLLRLPYGLGAHGGSVRALGLYVVSEVFLAPIPFEAPLIERTEKPADEYSDCAGVVLSGHA
jgi:hypothetical protein